MCKEIQYDTIKKKQTEALIEIGAPKSWICEEVGITYNSFTYVLKKWGLYEKYRENCGNNGSSYLGVSVRPEYYSKVEGIVKKLCNEGKTLKQISKSIDYPLSTTAVIIDQLGLTKIRKDNKKDRYSEEGKENVLKSLRGPKPQRSGTKHWTAGKMKLRDAWVTYNTAKEEYQYYIDQDLKLREMEELIGVNERTVRNHLKKLGLKIGIRTGKRHPQWRGGHIRYRGPDWSSARKEALKRDNYTCQHCGITEDEHRDKNGRGLDVHHKIPWIECKSNEVVNLISLCNSCHSKEEYENGRYA